MKEVELTKDVELILPNGNRITGTELLQMFEEQEVELKEYIKSLGKQDLTGYSMGLDTTKFDIKGSPKATREDDRPIEPIVYDMRPREIPKGCFGSLSVMDAAVLVRYDIIQSNNLSVYQREMVDKIIAEYKP